MKKILILLMLVFVLTGCSKSSEEVSKSIEYNKDYDIALVDENGVNFLSFDGMKLKDKSFIEKPDSYRYISNSKSFNKDKYLLRSYTKEAVKNYIGVIDRKTFSTKNKKINGAVYTAYADDNYYYYADPIQDSLDLFKYDMELNQIKSRKLDVQNAIAPNRIIEYNNELYLLSTEGRPPSMSNYLTRFTKDLDVLERINLGYENTALFRMANAGNKLYISQTFVEAGQTYPGSKLIIYDLDTRETKEVILDMTFPSDIVYDKKNNQILVFDSHTKDELKLAILNVGEDRPKYYQFDCISNDYVEDSVTISKGKIYFESQDNLYVFDRNTNEYEKYNFADLGHSKIPFLMASNNE